MKCKMLYHDTCVCELELEVCLYSCLVRHVFPLPGGAALLKNVVPKEFQETEESVCSYLTGFLSNRIIFESSIKSYIDALCIWFVE